MPKYHGLAFWLQRPADPASIVAALRARQAATPGRRPVQDGAGHVLARPRRCRLGACSPRICRPALAGSWPISAPAGAISPPRSSIAVRRSKAIDLLRGGFRSPGGRQGQSWPGVQARIGFFWHDLAAETVTRRYDAVVMNPPFHRGRAADPALGQAMIGKAAAALTPGGRLLMVANRQLPYEAILADGVRALRARSPRDRDFKAARGTSPNSQSRSCRVRFSSSSVGIETMW